jgi:8-oxo-dGTP pyrophosphatase MutT (NUDIX family)
MNDIPTNPTESPKDLGFSEPCSPPFDSPEHLRTYLLQLAQTPANLMEREGEPVINYHAQPILAAVSCYAIWQNKVLSLQRSALINCPGTWGAVSGYIDSLALIQSSPSFCRDHAQIEFAEEVGWQLAPEQLRYCGSHLLIKPQLQIHFEIFGILLEDPPAIVLNPEHDAYTWIRFSDLDLWQPKLITQFGECFRQVRAHLTP